MQPKWKFLANLGDVSPLEYGGLFLYIDETGVYDPEVEAVVVYDEGYDVEIYRVCLERCYFTDGVLSDNKYHLDHPTWWSKDLSRFADSEPEFINNITGDDPRLRAFAYEAIAAYYGWHEFDHYPLRMSGAEARQRYLERNGEDYSRAHWDEQEIRDGKPVE